MNTKEIAAIINAHGKVSGQHDVQWLLTDSRSLSFPATSIFFALRTQRNDGHKYIAELYERGVRCFVIEYLPEDSEHMENAELLIVSNPLRALQTLAANHRNHYDIPIVGITGSNGKTIVKEWLYQLLSPDYQTIRSPRSYNSQIGVPLSVWQLRDDTQLALFEAGISQPNEMTQLQTIIQPTIGILTNIGDAHQENFVSLHQKCEEKMRLFDTTKLLIYSKDIPLIDEIARDRAETVLTWGKCETADIRIIDTQHTSTGTHIIYQYQGQENHYCIPFSDKASIENSLHCLALLLYFGYSAEVINDRMQQLPPIAMRLEVKEGVRNCIVINDSYNTDITSLTIALDFLEQQAATKQLKRALVLSDIMQSGQTPEELYSQVAQLLESRHIDTLVGIGPMLLRHKQFFSNIPHHSFYPTTERYLVSGDYRLLRQSIILLKGSRLFSLEQLSRHLEKTVHETVLEVNLSALTENFNYFRSKLLSDTKIMCMVKAFAYGSGAIEVARTLQHNGCDYLAVAVADEGAELRRAGIHVPILVMDPEMNALDVIIENNLEPNLYNFRIFEAFTDAIRRQGLAHYPVHLKIDSGMHRLGFEWKDMESLINLLCNQEYLAIRSVFSHLAGADESRFDDFTRQQINTFTRCADHLQAALTYPFLRHILNSAGIERFTDNQMDMVRLGIGHYGFSSLPDIPLRNVCTLRTVILQIKDVPAGESIGYGRKAMLTTNRRIGVIPIGYADGFDRKLGNGVGTVSVNGTRCPVIGNICMDLAMIDLTEVQAAEGDIVTIFGDELPIDEVANKLGTISYEVLTGVSRRVKRVYYQE